jgi:ribosomal protein L11 methyltransferase
MKLASYMTIWTLLSGLITLKTFGYLTQHLLPKQLFTHKSNHYTFMKMDNLESEFKTPSSGNSLQQLSLKYDCDEIDSDTISEYLFELGSLSVSCEVNEEKKFYLEERKWSDIQKTKNWQIATLKANFPLSFDLTSLIDVIQMTFPDIQFIFQRGFVEDRDWILHVQSSWEPMIVGDLKISFPWHDDTPIAPAPGQRSINHKLTLEGGAAFGTGDHPTTRLCLKWIQRHFQTTDYAGQDMSILDYGCGSAILGLSGLLYGATEAAGVDIDIDSLNSAKWNAERNNMKLDLYLSTETDSEHEGNYISGDDERSIGMNQFKGKNQQMEAAESL